MSIMNLVTDDGKKELYEGVALADTVMKQLDGYSIDRVLATLNICLSRALHKVPDEAYRKVLGNKMITCINLVVEKATESVKKTDEEDVDAIIDDLNTEVFATLGRYGDKGLSWMSTFCIAITGIVLQTIDDAILRDKIMHKIVEGITNSDDKLASMSEKVGVLH